MAGRLAGTLAGTGILRPSHCLSDIESFSTGFAPDDLVMLVSSAGNAQR